MKFTPFAFLAALALTLLPELAFAQIGLDYTEFNLSRCPVGELLCSLGINDTVVIDNLVKVARGKIFPAILFAMIVYYAFKLVLRSNDESAQGEVKLAFTQAIFGTALVGGAFLMASSFGSSNVDVVSEGGINSVMNSVAGAVTALVFTAVVVNIFIQAYRLIFAQEDSDVDSAKKRLVHGAIGGAIAILAVSAVDAFFGVNVTVISDEAAGIGSFLATIFGALAVIGMIISGIMLVVSVSESLKDRARRLLLISVAALVIVISAYSIIRFFADI